MSKKQLQNFYFHPKSGGPDGNSTPLPTAEGWIVVVGKDINQAIKRLPLVCRTLVEKVWEDYKKENNANDDPHYFDDYHAVKESSAGFGIPYTFLNQVEWESYLEECR